MMFGMVPEPQTPAAVAQGVLQFALLIVIGEATGLGLLTLLRCPADWGRRLLLAPFAATMFWALTGNLLVRYGFTMAEVTPGLALVSLGLAALAIAWLVPARVGLWWTTVVVVSLGLVVAAIAWPLFPRGLSAHLGSPNLDTVHYTTTAAGFWQWGLDATSATSAFFQRYAPSLRGFGVARNHTYVLLAFFSPLGEPGEPMLVRNVLVCWSLFVLASSLAYYRASWGSEGTARETPIWRLLLYAGLTMGIGWAVIPSLVGNWDNGLLVSVGPAIAGLAREIPPRVGYPLLLGTTIAYAVYTYPELAIFAILFAAPFHLGPLLRAGGRARTWLTYGLAGVTGVVLLWPGAPPLWRFFRGQLYAARAPGMRPGGLFAQGLVAAAWDPAAWWALGAEHATSVQLSWDSLTGLLLAGLALAGIGRLTRGGAWAETASLCLVLGSVGYYALVDHYGYAAYKLLSVSWWLIGRCLVEGITTLAAVASTSADAGLVRRRLGLIPSGAVVLVLLVSLVHADRVRRATHFSEAIFRQLPTPVSLTRLRDAARHQPPADVLVTSAVAGPLLAPWVFYVLRDTSVRPFLEPGGPTHIPGSAAWPADGTLPETVLLPTTSPRPAARFVTPEFTLVDSASTPLIERVDSPNGYELWGTWLGTRAIRVTFIGRAGLRMVLTFDASPGPSLPETSRRTLVLRSGSREIGRLGINGPGPVAFPFVTAGGREVFTLSTPDVPTVAVMPNGDRRPLLVKVERLRIDPAGAGS